MKITQEKLPNSQIGLKVEIPAETAQKAYEIKINTLARTANIPGFRKGKVPRSILLQRLGNRYIKAATLEELVQDSLKKAIDKESIKAIGNYTLKDNLDKLIDEFQPGQPLTFSAQIDVPPSVQLGTYKELCIKAEEKNYDTEQVENWLKERQEKLATLVPVEDRSSQIGDVAIVDYQGFLISEGKVADQPIEGVEGKNFRVDLEKGKFIEGMIEGIVGMKPGESKELPLIFPEDYPREDLAKKSVNFNIKLTELKAKELPELDNDFADEVSEFGTITELKNSLEKQFIESAKSETQDNIHNAITEELTKNCIVDLPDTLIQEEITKLLTQTAMKMEEMGVDLSTIFNKDNLPKLRENAHPEAIVRLKKILILQEIASVETIAIEEKEIESKSNELKEKLKGQNIDLDKLYVTVKEQLMVEKTFNWLQEKSEIELCESGSLDITSKKDSDVTEEIIPEV